MRVSQLAKYHYSSLGPSQGHNNISITKIYVNTTIYTYTYTYTYTYIHTYIHTHIHTYICIHKNLK